ncbi:class I SAM-dependent methyltransferase [Jiulongibacter sediminis]|uniref:class I SAM-dependent methyltransferase n=1 Tax=Jiulongibacter sediminis TaxID=1605367 RepID=UPI0026E9A740|nr:class I SAM-dependent methyltransferase [Jiulongibacter sediminis]
MELRTIQNANAEARILGQIDPADLALKNPENWSLDFLKLVLTQYQFLQKLAPKLPEWAENQKIIGGENVNIEQSSSELTARYKFSQYRGKRAADLTGGFGIDTYFLSKKFEMVDYCEPNPDLFEVVKYNFHSLGVSNVNFHCRTAEDFLNQNSEKFDLIYLDPDRRSEKSSKLVLIEDCRPNLTDIQDTLLHFSSKVLIKYSPLLDIKLALKTLKKTVNIKVLAVKNDVKELLFEVSSSSDIEDISLSTVNLSGEDIQDFEFRLMEEENATVAYSEPLNYLYEPNAAIMKSGAFKAVGKRFGLAKIAQHSHFYTSEKLVKDFPGRIFKVEESTTAAGKALKKWKNTKVNVISRNYPLKPETLRQKYRLNDGSDEFLIFTTDYKNEKILITCTRNL